MEFGDTHELSAARKPDVEAVEEIEVVEEVEPPVAAMESESFSGGFELVEELDSLGAVRENRGRGPSGVCRGAHGVRGRASGEDEIEVVTVDADASESAGLALVRRCRAAGE